MAGNNVSTAREALLAELLQDADALVRRFEQVDESLTAKIEQATTDAAGKAFLTAKLNFEAVMDKNAEKLTEAGRYGAAMIGNQLGSSTAQLLAAHAALNGKIGRFMFLMIVVSFATGSIFGFIGARLAGA